MGSGKMGAEMSIISVTTLSSSISIRSFARMSSNTSIFDKVNLSKKLSIFSTVEIGSTYSIRGNFRLNGVIALSLLSFSSSWSQEKSLHCSESARLF